MNSYEIYKEIREGIGEEAAAHWGDLTILRKMNRAQKTLWQDLTMTSGDWFLESVDLTPVASVITIPSYCGKLVRMENKATKLQIPIATVRDKDSGNGIMAYFTRNGLTVSDDDYSDVVTIWFLRRLIDLHFGTAGTGSGASELHFDITNSPSVVDDYYNDLDVDVWSTTFLPKLSTTITDYVGSTKKATITGTPASGDFYGTIPSIPEEGHYLIVLDVITKCLMKPGSNFDLEYVKLMYGTWKNARTEWLEWIELRAAKRSYIARGREE